jgi:iron complex outermembrane receptor protein
MTPTRLSLAIASALSLLAFPAHANDSALTLGEIKVSAKTSSGPLSSRNVLTSVDLMGGERFENQTVASSWELLGLMPGIQLTEFRMGAESGKATFRAFNGEGYINGIKVLIDGVPSNVNSGNQRFIDMVPTLELAAIEVVRGTNDPRYGLHNIGGNINLVTREGGNYTEGRLTYGSFNTQEGQVVVGREADGFSQNYYISKQVSDGWRPNSDSDRVSLGGKWFYNVGQTGVRVGAVLRHHRNDSKEPGYLTAAELAQDRKQSPAKNANDRSDREMNQASALLDWQVNDRLFWSNKLYYNHYADDRRFSISQTNRQRRVWNEEHLGLISTLTWRASKLITLDGGINIEQQENSFSRRRFANTTPTDFNATPTAIQADDAHSFNNVGAYVQAVIQPTPAWKVVPALRVDRFSGSTHLRNTGARAPLQDYGWIHQPKMSVVYSPTAQASVYANWGQTFQVLTGSRSPAYLAPSNVRRDASINTGYEMGVKLKPMAGAEARVALWRQDATDEVANMPSINATTALGQTQRQGLDLQASARLNQQLTLWASHTLQEAKVIKAFTDSGVSLAGKEVMATPRHISNIGMDFKASDAWQFGAQARSQGSYFIDDINAQRKYGGFAVLDISVRHHLSRQVSVDLQLKNVTDRQFEYVWDNGGSPMFSPAAGRSGFISLNVKL